MAFVPLLSADQRWRCGRPFCCLFEIPTFAFRVCVCGDFEASLYDSSRRLRVGNAYMSQQTPSPARFSD